MAAYAALVSLFNDLELIPNHPTHSFSFDNKQLSSLSQTVNSLIDFMETYDSHGCTTEAAEALESRIASAARAAHDVIESHLVDQIHAGSTLVGGKTGSYFLPDLQRAIEGVEFVRTETMQFQAKSGLKAEQPKYSSAPSTSSTEPLLTGNKKNAMVGFDSVLVQLLDILTGEPSNQRSVVPIVRMSQVTLRNGKELRNPPSKNSEIGSRVESDKAMSQNQSGNTPSLAKQATAPEFLLKKDVDEEFDLGTPVEVHKHLILDVPDIKIPAPFPERLAGKKPKEDLMDFMSIFGKMEINMPFLQAIKLPELSKFMREFIAGKSKKASKIVMSENVSAVIKKNLPPKCKDPGMFSLPCSFGDTKIKHAMCDLGASINVMPLSVYNRLNGVELVDANVVIQLADKSCVYPVGLLENVLVKVHDFVYPVDFYVVEMNDMESKDSTGVLLGRPFLRTARTVIDVFSGTICLDYNGEKFTFNIDDTMKNPPIVESVSAITVTNPCVQEPLETNLLQDKLEFTLTKSLNEVDAQGIGDEGMKTNVPSLIAYLEEAVSGITVSLPKRSTCNRLVSSHMLSNKCEERKKKRVKKKKPHPKFYDAFKWYEDLQRMYYDKKRMGKTFKAGQKVLYESKLPPEPGKLKTGWFGPFEIQSVYETGAIMMKSLDKAQFVLVNCHKLKPYLDASSKKSVKEISQSPQTSS